MGFEIATGDCGEVPAYKYGPYGIWIDCCATQRSRVMLDVGGGEYHRIARPQEHACFTQYEYPPAGRIARAFEAHEYLKQSVVITVRPDKFVRLIQRHPGENSGSNLIRSYAIDKFPDVWLLEELVAWMTAR
jgi:hypothetical protein